MKNDPFSFDRDSDKTVLKPRDHSSSRSTEANRDNSRPTSEIHLAGEINELERAASRLLPLVVTLKSSSTVADPEALRKRLIDEISTFKQQAHEVLGDPKKVTQASYVMCTALDEAAMNTPWGHQANWAQHNLLSTFHNEVGGGEKFFRLLKSLGKDAKDNIQLLELMFVCLSLGYEGAYRIAPNGKDTLIRVRQWLFDIIRSVRGNQTTPLSSHWKGTEINERRLPRMTPLWVMCAAGLALASLLFLSLQFWLVSHRNTVINSFWGAAVADLAVNDIELPPAPAVIATPSNKEALTLGELLSLQISAGKVAVDDSYEKGNITLPGTDLFASGNDVLQEKHFNTIDSIAEALDKFDGEIIVTGHSDNIPIKSGRWASNLELSKARAESVRQLLAQKVRDPLRLSSVGRGSLEPIADNSTIEGRSTNRRVEITLYY